MMLVISGCGTPFQKPTGLETEEQSITDIVDDALEDTIKTQVEDEEDVQDTIAQEERIAKDVVGAGKVATPKQENDALKESETVIKSEIKSSNKSEANQQATESADKTKSSAVANKPANQQASESAKPALTKPVPPKPATTKPEPITPTPEKPATEPESKASTIVYSIVIAAGEIPLPPTTMDIKDGDTVLNALINITKKNRVQMDYRGGQGATAYVEGIDNVYEFDRGQGSGWMYRVNGIFPDRGAGAVRLLDGDRVEWLYTTNLGVDLNANLKPFRRSE